MMRISCTNLRLASEFLSHSCLEAGKPQFVEAENNWKTIRKIANIKQETREA